MGKIDGKGTYLGTIAESGVGETKNGKPQWVVRLAATQKYITDAAELTHFQLTEPGYQVWDSFGEDITGFLMLFNSNETFDASTQMKNYEQLQIATGWDGQAFDSLADGNLIGKEILFRVQDKKPYVNDKGDTIGEGELEIGWIDHKDAAPERTLKSLDASGIKALNAKLKGVKISPKAVAAKPVSAGTPKPTTTNAAATPVAPVAVQSAPVAAAKPPKAKAAPKPTPVEEPAEEQSDGLPTEITKEAAWVYVNSKKGDVSDGELADAWLVACEEAGNGRIEDEFTTKDWARVRDIVLKEWK